jgi:hypothetical protein
MPNVEGPISGAGHVIDSGKYQCTNCNGSKFYISKTIDDPNDITQDTTFADKLLTITGGVFLGLVGMCAQCGHEQVIWWMCFDVAASNAGALTMTNLDQSTTANLMAGLYMVYLGSDANDQGKYFIVATNTAAAPTVITPTIAPHNDSDGVWMITNLLPVGYTAAT